MSKIFVVKRRAGIESIIPVWNLGGFIELPVAYSGQYNNQVIEALDGILSLEEV